MSGRLAVAALAVAWLAPNSALAADKTLTAGRVDVNLVLARDGSVAVTERVVFHFDGGPFTSITRDLSTRNTDGVEVIGAAVDGMPYPVGRGAGHLRVERENGLRVTWRFASVSDATRTFTLSYRTRGVVRSLDGYDAFTWRALPARRSYSVRAITVRVVWPEGGTLVGAPSVSHGDARVAENGGAVTIAARDEIRPGTGLDLTLMFASGSVAAAPPMWQVRQERGRAAAPGFAMAGGAILLSGIAWMLIFWNGRRREPLPIGSENRETAPPDELPAALASALVSQGTAGTWTHAVGTLLDLARRGIVQIEELPGRSFPGVKDYVVHLASRPAELRAHERGLLELLFVSKDSSATSVKLSAAGKAAQQRLKLFKLPVGEELTAAGLVSPERAQTRSALVRWGLLLVVLAAVGFVVAAVLTREYSGWPLLVPGSVMLVAVSVLVMASQFSVLSTSGRLRAARWRSFFAFIKNIAKGREPIADPSWFQRYLPFAAACGIGTRWTRAFDRFGQVQGAPPWFTAGPAGDSGKNALAQFSQMLARAAAVGAPQQYVH